jgi:hypothetical protein
VPPKATNAATAREAVGALSKGAAEGLAVGIGTELAIGFVAGVAGVSAGVLGATVGLVLLPFAIYGIASHWDDISDGIDRLTSGEGTVEDFEALGNVAGGLLAGGAAKSAGAVGEELGQVTKSAVKSAASSLADEFGPSLATAGGPKGGSTSWMSSSEEGAGGGGSASSAVGASREQTVAELTGGKVASGKRIVVPGFGSTDIDVLGPNGEIIAVGGPAKAINLAKLGGALRVQKALASLRGVNALAYFEEGTPEEALALARRWLGDDNVKIFRR